MAQKWQTISELAAETSRKVTHSPEEWCRFLTTAARFYKAYDFDDQLLIYAQKPNATACADMPTWNNKMRRWVNAGSTAIALIRKGYGGKPYLDYVHDVADTHPVRGGKDPWLWKLTEENREPVMERLRDTFGIDGSGDLGDLLMETAEKLVQESYGEYLPDLLYEREDSFLEELDDFNVEVLFRNTLRASVQYAVLSRCGLDVSRYLDAEDFREITNFNTTAALACLGTINDELITLYQQEIAKCKNTWTVPNHTERDVELARQRKVDLDAKKKELDVALQTVANLNQKERLQLINLAREYIFLRLQNAKRDCFPNT